ncbi:MAG: U32 family peptidase [Thermodesulfobacteriota bacterium]|nr:U32 family peptidase [Thermodesulfobacteriota bacterium]
MKLRVGTNWDFGLLDALSGTSVDALFGKLPFDVVGGARPGFVLPQVDRNYVERYIRTCHEKGLEFSYLLNAPCLGNLQYSRKGYGQIIDLLQWIDHSGADSVVVGAPYLIDLIRKRFPRFKVKASTTARVNTVRKALQYEEMGVEEIIIDEHINREFKALEAIRKAVKCNLELLVNNICLWQCPYNYEHVNHDGHASRQGEEEAYCYLQYPGYLCLYRKLMEPVELLKSPWIRPEDLSHYEELGYDHFKITERFKRTPLLLEHVETYQNRRYDGNLLDLFTLPRKGAFTPIHLEYFIKPEHVNIIKISELEKVFDLEVRDLIRLDNRKLDGFIEHFKKTDCNQISCLHCRYCETVFEKAATVNREGVKKAAQRVMEFSDKLLTGEIFDAPASHFIFRIPLAKPLLKHLLKWRMRREQAIDDKKKTVR